MIDRELFSQTAASFENAALRFREPAALYRSEGSQRVAVYTSAVTSEVNGQWLGTLPAVYPEWLGDRSFCETHRLRFPYVGGSMARGIASEELVIALANNGCLGFFGAAGLPLARVSRAIDTITTALSPERTWGVNLIHSPNEPAMEEALVDLFLKKGVTRVEASAFMQLSPSVVRYAAKGLMHDANGNIQRQHHVFAKVSRTEVARQFMSPAPAPILEELVAAGQLTRDEAELALRVPVAAEIIVESDSGGHTDNRPLGALFPAIVCLRETLQQQFGYQQLVRLGAAGGLGTPESIHAAFAMGAAFVVLGSVHQACVESGLSESGCKLLAEAEFADVAMTASADMFEMGVKVQVLKRGTLMSVRGNQLYQIYHRYNSIDAIPREERARLESQIFGQNLEAVWDQTVAFFSDVEPSQISRAEQDPRHKMALIFRWYLGKSSHWPIVGDDSRRNDYQIWCGPAMGAFNAWVQGSFLEDYRARQVAQVALNLLEGACVISRALQLRQAGAALTSLPGYKPKLWRLNTEDNTQAGVA